MPTKKTQYIPAEVKQKITADFVIDMYEKAVQEKDDDTREAMLATVKVLSENIGTYLVSDTNEITNK